MRKKTGQIKGLISRRWLILNYTIQHVIPNVCIKFQNPIVPLKSVMKNFHIHYIRVRDRKREKKNLTVVVSQIVPEKPLEEKSLHTNIVTEKVKTISPPYTSYTGGIMTSSVSLYFANSST